MTNLLIWGGPVYGPGSAPPGSDDVGQVAWQVPTDVLTVNTGVNGGYSSGAFSGLAASLKGNILGSLLARKGKTRADYDKIAIAGFSAFHGLAAPLLDEASDQIDAAVLLDACFSATNPSTWTKAGYVKFGQLAAQGSKLMVYTSSWGGGPTAPYPSSTGSECAKANYDASAANASPSGALFEPRAVPAGAVERRTGNLFWLDYRDKYFHGQHINDIGLDVLDAFLPDYMAGQRMTAGAPSKTKTWEWVVVAAALFGAAWGGKRWIDSRASRG